MNSNYRPVPSRSSMRDTGEDLGLSMPRSPSSIVRRSPTEVEIYQGDKRYVFHKGHPSAQKKKRRFLSRLHPLVYVACTLLLIWLGSTAVSWFQSWQLDQQYGYPRVSQLDAVVGHNDSATNKTHFLFLNLHGHVQIIEIPGGDASHARIFTGPTLIGAGQDLIPVTGEIVSEDGRLDLIVHIQDQQIMYINDGSTFKEQ